MSYLDESVTSITGFEGAIPWMYLDSRGLVTAGVGHMIPDAKSAQALSFQDSSGQAASADAILADYNRVLGMTSNRASDFYKVSASLLLSEKAIAALLLANLQACDQSLRSHFVHYDTFPAPAKLALLDMVFNLGAAKLFGTYPHFCAAVSAGDWNTAAAQCHREGPGQARNHWTAQQFQLAAQ